MASLQRMSLQMLTIVNLLDIVRSYNIDISHPRIITGSSGSTFGYSTVFENTKSGHRLLVGAPKDKGTAPSRDSGVVYRCNISNALDCEGTYHKPTNYIYLPLENIYYTDYEMYGSVLLETPDGDTVSCANRFNDLQHVDNNVPLTIGRCVFETQDQMVTNENPFLNWETTETIDEGLRRRSTFKSGMGQFGMAGDSGKPRKTIVAEDGKNDKNSGSAFSFFRQRYNGTIHILVEFLKLASTRPKYKLGGYVILGAPGYREWRGSVVVMTRRENGAFWDAKVYETPLDKPEYAYLGYSVVAGNFCGDEDLCFAAGSPRRETGEVYLYEYNTTTRELITRGYPLQGDQVFSHFGASLCAVDVNADGLDDLLVGAPLFTEFNRKTNKGKKVFQDEGRVAVYLNNRETMFADGPSLTLKGSNSESARFGTTITNIGDVNHDGFDDVAISAPYEDEGRGVVYIYHGGRNGLNPRIQQRIRARDIHENVTSLGWSIAKAADIDKNTYPDIAFGNYLSDSVVILRTRPIVDIVVTLTPNSLMILSDSSTCPPGVRSEGCVELTICIRYNGTSLPSKLNFTYTLSVDTTKQKGLKRVQLISGQRRSDSITRNVTASSEVGFCETLVAETISKIRDRDPFSAVRLEATYFLHQPADPSSDIQPISNHSRPDKVETDISFQLNCGSDNLCSSYLMITLDAQTTQADDRNVRQELTNTVVVNATENIIVNVDVTNDGEDAFATFVYFTWDGELTMKTTIIDAQKPVKCDEDDARQGFKVKCEILFPVKANSSVQFQIVLTIDAILLNEPEVVFMALVESGSDDKNPNNTGRAAVNVWIDAATSLDGKSEPEQVLVPMSDVDEYQVTLRHKYVIQNKGPSFLPVTKVTVLVPYFKKDQSELVDNATVQLQQEDKTFSTCKPLFPSSGLDQNKTTTESSLTTPTTGSSGSESTTRFIIPPPQMIDRPEPSKQVSGLNSHDITCEEYQCVEFECWLQNLSPGRAAIVNVNAQIPAKRLPLEAEEIDLVKYFTKTMVLRPEHKLLYKPTWRTPVVKQIWTSIYPENPAPGVNIWIIIGSVLGGLILFIIIFIILYRCGFFKRDKKGKIQKWKRESGYYHRQESRAPRDSALVTPETEPVKT